MLKIVLNIAEVQFYILYFNFYPNANTSTLNGLIYAVSNRLASELMNGFVSGAKKT